MVRVALALAALLVGGGCATWPPPSCAGLAPVDYRLVAIDGGGKRAEPVYPRAEDRIARLRCEADRGVSNAATDLARRYETGDGVAVDLARAAELYARAATPVPAFTHIYAPPVRLGGRGQVLILPNASGTPGDPEAQYRLARLYLDGRGVDRSPERGRRLLERAAGQNYRPALEALSLLGPARP